MTSVHGPSGPKQQLPLPGTTVDRIRDGVSLKGDPAENRKTIRSALYSTANSAVRSGWSFADWVSLLDGPLSMLGEQSRFSGHKGRTLTRVKWHRELFEIWADAEKYVAANPMPWEFLDIMRAIGRIRASVTGAPLRPADRAVMLAACDLAEKYSSLTPALPYRGLMELTGLGDTATRTSLRRLIERGWLKQVYKGKPGGPKAGRRMAAVYRIQVPPL